MNTTAPIKTARIHHRKFKWDKERKTFTANASALFGRGAGNPHAGGRPESIDMIGAQKTIRFRMAKTFMHWSGEERCWLYWAADMPEIKVVVYNR